SEHGYNTDSECRYNTDSELGTDSELRQEFDDLTYDHSEDLSSKNKFNTNTDCSSNNESESVFTNIDDLPKIFDGTKYNSSWNYGCPFEPFKNFTNLAMFIWVTEYMTSTAAYYNLVQILYHPKFNINHLPTNLQSLKKQREQLPLMKIQSHMAPINIKNTLSTIKDCTRVYYFSLIEHFQRILKNPSLSSQLYFGPGIFSESCEEFGQWKLRSIKLRHQHPAECLPIKLPTNTNLPVLKFYLDLYYDDFGTFRNTYYSLGRVYLQVGNMPRRLRKWLRNHFIIGLVPFGGSLKDFIKVIINEIHQLEQRFIMNINGVDCWVSGELAMATADLPQENDIAGVLQHNANLGYHSCKAPKDKLTDLSFDIYFNGRYYQITNQEFQHISEQLTKTTRSRLCSQYELRLLPSPLDPILHDRYQYTLQDVYHAIAGKLQDSLIALHDLELTLLCQINTLQMLRYLVDGVQINNTDMTIFKDLFIEPKFRHLLSGWCIDISNFSIHTSQEYDQ
ncbi:5616_t:CDS:2, partial [Racocetra persica]